MRRCEVPLPSGPQLGCIAGPPPSPADAVADHVRAPRDKKFVSPSDDIMSPCTAKLSKLRNKQVSK